MQSLKERWTVKEERRLIDLVNGGLSYDQCSNILGRSNQAITNRMYIIRKRLALVESKKQCTKKVKTVNKVKQVEQEEESTILKLGVCLSALLNVALTAHIVFNLL